MEMTVDRQALCCVSLPFPSQHAPIELFAPVKAEPLAASTRAILTDVVAATKVVAAVLGAHAASQWHTMSKHNSTHARVQDGHGAHGAWLVCHVKLQIVAEIAVGRWVICIKDNLLITQDRAVLEKIGDLLGTTVKKLRSIQPDDPNHFGGLYGQAYRTCNAFRFSKGPDYENYGPFDNYETTVDRLIWASMVTQAMSSNAEWRDYERVLFRDARRILLDSATEEDRKPVLTFFLFMECNILVQLVRDEEGKIIDVKKISFARWEPLGWMPSWYDVAYFQREAKIVHLEKWAPLMQKVLDQIKLANMELADFYDRGLTDMVFPLDVS